MASIYSQTLKCPVCNTYFEDFILTSNNEFVYYESDLRPCSLGIDPVPYQVHTCPICYYSAYDFPEEINQDLRDYITSKRFLTGIDTGTLLPFTKYHLSAKIMEFEQESLFEIGFAYLKASWMARKCHIQTMENFYQIKTFIRFEELYYNGMYELPQKPVVVYILGELTRRLKYFDLASKYFSLIQADKTYSMYAQQIMLLVKRNNSEITILNI
jgi:uncharacterized protein (DUF2225 family)